MVETQLCKLHGAKKLKNVSCEYGRLNGWNSNVASCVMPYTKKLLVWYWSLWPPMRYDAVARIRVQTSTAFPVIVVAPGTVRPKHWKPENGSTTILTTLAGNVMPVWCSYQGPHVHYIAGHVGVIPRYELLLPHLHQVLFLWSDNERAARTSVSNTPAHFFRSQVFFRSRFTIFIFFSCFGGMLMSDQRWS